MSLPAGARSTSSIRSPATSQVSGAKCRNERRRVIDPSGSLYHHWSMVVSLAFLYNFWSLSYRFAFQEINRETVALWFALDYSADFIYLLDVMVNFRTGYLEDGVLQRKLDKISQHYRDCTLFYLDCFCLLPLDVLYLSIGFNSILRCTRLVKIYKFWAYVDRTERHTNYPNVFRTFSLVHYILVIFHWNACLFHMIHKNKLIDIENLYNIRKNDNNNNNDGCRDVLCQYLHAFYWSTLALTTIGDLPSPRTKGEYLYVTCELFFGLFVFASVLGHVANIVTNVSAARKEFQGKLDAVKTFMRTRRVSEELQNKVIRWFDYLWISQKSSDEDKTVACLPDRLKAEIAIQVHLDTLRRVDIFQNTEAGFLCELVLRLKPVLVSPGDYVCRKNEVGHEMYIVSRGTLEVVAELESADSSSSSPEQVSSQPASRRKKASLNVVATLRAGSYFGEISVLNLGSAGNKRTASVRSVGYSDLFCLNKQDLWDVLKNYPAAEQRIRARAEERLSKLESNQQHVCGESASMKTSKRQSGENAHSNSHDQASCSTCRCALHLYAEEHRSTRHHRRDRHKLRGGSCHRRHQRLVTPTFLVAAPEPMACCMSTGSGQVSWLNQCSRQAARRGSRHKHRRRLDGPPPRRPTRLSPDQELSRESSGKSWSSSVAAAPTTTMAASRALHWTAADGANWPTDCNEQTLPEAVGWRSDRTQMLATRSVRPADKHIDTKRPTSLDRTPSGLVGVRANNLELDQSGEAPSEHSSRFGPVRQAATASKLGTRQETGSPSNEREQTELNSK